MATLHIEGIDALFYEQIQRAAESQRRSVSQQILHVLKEYFAKEKQMKKASSPAEVLLELAGSWQDERDADEIINEIKNIKRNSYIFFGN